MHRLEQKINALIAAHNLIQQDDKILLGLSGGPDSMALLHILASLAAGFPFRLAAAYIDHNLRPDESPHETALVQEQCAKLGIEILCDTIPVREYAAKQKLSIEHAARMLRYECFTRHAQEIGATKIAVAHTADDQAEEILIRLIKGAGRKGLSGMLLMRDNSIIRPLLTTYKTELLSYLQKKNIPFALDSSNLSAKYLRNRVRNELLPYLAENFNPGIRETLAQSATILQAEEELLDKLTQDKAAAIIIHEEKDEEGLPEVAINTAKLLAEPLAIGRRVLEKVIIKMRSDPRFSHIEDILNLAKKGLPESIIHLSRGLRVQKKQEKLIFFYPRGKTPHRQSHKERSKVDFNLTITAEGEYLLPAINKSILIRIRADKPTAAEYVKMEADYLAFDNLDFPLIIRAPQTGDVFHPLGAPGRKKIKDFLKDKKVPQQKRSHIPVLLKENKIMALLGVQIDEEFKVGAETKSILEVRLT